MITLKLPQTDVLFAERPYSPKAVNSLFSLVKRRPGSQSLILTAESSNHSLILFILESGPFAAARIAEDRFEPLSLREFFVELYEAQDPKLTLNAISPVLFKCLLVTIQKAPTTSGTTDLVNVDALLERLKASKNETVVTVKHLDSLSFFYFTKGKLYEACFADPSVVSQDSPLEDQFLESIYAPSATSPILIRTFEDVQIEPAEDHDLDWDESQEGLVEYFLKPRPELVLLSGGTLTKKVIHKREFILGRGPDSDLQLDDIKASREHAVIRETRGHFVLDDQKSRNGTLLNNKKVSQSPLSDGDEIQIGQTRIMFTQEAVKPTKRELSNMMELDTTQIKISEAGTEGQPAQPPVYTKELSLRMTNGPQRGLIIPLGKKLSIGRTRSDLNLNDAKVSRHHATIEERENGYVLSDHNSTNGSQVNDVSVQTKVLLAGDIVKVGDTTLEIIERDSLP